MSTDSVKSSSGKSKSDLLVDEIIKVSIQEKEEKEARIIETKKEVENRYYGIKKPLIEQLKDALIKEGFGNKTVVEICRRLRGYVTEPYIRKIVDDPELKDQSKVRVKQEVPETEQELEQPMAMANDGSLITGSDNDPNVIADNEDKYYQNKPKLQNPSNSTVINESTGLAEQKDIHAIQALTVRNQELEQKLNALEQERILHTTVRLNKALFQRISNFINDKGVKAVLLDFNNDMDITDVRAVL